MFIHGWWITWVIRLASRYASRLFSLIVGFITSRSIIITDLSESWWELFCVWINLSTVSLIELSGEQQFVIYYQIKSFNYLSTMPVEVKIEHWWVTITRQPSVTYDVAFDSSWSQLLLFISTAWGYGPRASALEGKIKSAVPDAHVDLVGGRSGELIARITLLPPQSSNQRWLILYNGRLNWPLTDSWH